MSKRYKVPLKRHMELLQELANILGTEMDGLPNIFQTKAKRAFKIGFYDDLIAAYPDADKKMLRRWLSKWTNTDSYLYRITIGTNRHDLDGNDCGLIEEKDREYARSILAEREEKRKRAA